ncbi:MAG: hypothetical protein Q4G08_03840 [Capnocytophaga sp.]|nr:hypothetical protein [Capnocytophaga sp.]
MKRILMTALVALPLLLPAQNPPKGTFYETDRPDGLIVTFGDDNTYEISLMRGKYEIKGNNIIFGREQKDIFTLSNLVTAPGDLLSITLSSSWIPTGDNLMIGYVQADGTSKYETVYSLLEQQLSPEELEEQLYSPDYQTPVSVTIRIPRTETLYLVAAPNRYLNANAIIGEYPIGKQAASVEVVYDETSAYNYAVLLNGIFDGDKLKIWEGREITHNVIHFSKEIPAAKKQSLAMTYKKVENWEHFTETNGFSAYAEDYGYEVKDSETVAKKDIKASLNEALKLAKSNNRPLYVFYLPTDEKAQTTFANIVRKYERELDYYSGYETRDEIEFYLATDKDKKWLSKKGFSDDENIMIAVSPDDDLLYWQKGNVSYLSDNLYPGGGFSGDISSAWLALRLDRAITGKNRLPELQKTFQDALKLTNELPALYNKDSQYYYLVVPEKENLYHLKATQQQLHEAWNKIVGTHRKDKQVDLDYADVIYQNYVEKSYRSLIYNAEKQLTEYDLEALQYLIRFNEQIQSYRKHDNADANGNPIRFGYYYEPDRVVYNMLNKLADEQPQLRDKVKEAVLQGEEANMLVYYEVYSFLGRFYPQEYLTYFGNYYDKLTALDPNLIVALDKEYGKQPNFWGSWTSFKDSFANYCNSTAWHIVENGIRNPADIANAVRWSQSSLTLDPENPYYLDTMAHLLYFQGNKANAIEIQRKAVSLMSQKDESEYCCNPSVPDQMKQALEKMENGTLF